MRSPRSPTVLALLTACLVLAACEEENPDFDGDPEVPPESPDDIEPWSKLRGYRTWASDSDRHPSKGGGHPGEVRVFLSPELDASMAAGNQHHPAGAMAVKEIYEADKLTGITVSLKIDETSGDDPDPMAWYWWERSDGEVVADGPAVPLCNNCHNAAFPLGTDYVLSAYPLQ